MTIPKPPRRGRRTNITVRIAPDLRRRLEEYVKRYRCTQSAALVTLLDWALSQDEATS
jgi:hypothetical protein